MNAFVSHHPGAVTLEALARALAGGARAVRRAAIGLDQWAARRRRAGRDLATLAGMSDRELADIGIDRASVPAVASGAWQRDR